MRFQFIRAHTRTFHVTTMCRVLEVSKAGYYAWCVRRRSRRAEADEVLGELIGGIYAWSKRRYGSPRVHKELQATGVRCGEKRVARLMQENGLRAKSPQRFVITTRSDHKEPIAPNHLKRQFAVGKGRRPDEVWAADITYVPTKQGWLYLAVILDLATRRVVGWSLRMRQDQELATAALRMALKHRGARGGLHHSDRGVQFASGSYQGLLRAAGFTTSMSRVGDCWDNAVVESFFATLTKELLVDGVFETRQQASREIFEFIEIWYNRQRRHSSLGYRTPIEFEEYLQKVS